MLMGAGSEPTITLNNTSATAEALDPADATASYQLESDGDVSETEGSSGVFVDIGNWIGAAFAPGGYECMLHVNSGTNPTGAALDTWLALSSTRTWNLARTSVGLSTSNCTVSIRNAAGVVRATATVDFAANVEV